MEVKVKRKGSYDEFEGFTKLYELEWDNEPYQFNLTGLWKRDSDGTLWTADDSGCSCPTPWENTTELQRVFSLEPFEERYRERLTDRSYRSAPIQSEWEGFKKTVEDTLAALAAQ